MPISEHPNRRRFLGGAIATAASYQRLFGANDRIRVGAIGTGGRWGAIYDGLQKSGGNEIVAVCDVYEPRRLDARAKAAPGATDHVDYREILDRNDVDAVCIATPDHWHVRIATDAVRKFDSALLGYIEGGGLMFRGTKGAMRLHRAGYEVYEEIPNYTEAFKTPPAIMKGESTRDGTIDHVQNFLDCVRSREEPNAPVEIGVSAARAGHVANLALRGNGVWTA